MTILEDTLLVYAKLYFRNLPRSATLSIPHLRPLAVKLDELLEYTDWYCDAWPGREHIITFFSWREPAGLIPCWQVDCLAGAVTKL